MPIPLLYGFNALDTGILTVSGEATGKPKERLFDRRITFAWEDTSAAGARLITIDLGVGNAEGVDAYVVQAGHNLAGATILFQASTDMAVWNTRDSFAVPAGSTAMIYRTITLETTRGWRLSISGAAAPPQITELFITRQVAFPRFPSLGGVRQGLRPLINELESSAGYVWRHTFGDPLWFADYEFRDLTTAERTAIETLYTDLGGGAQFLYLLDADGVVRWVRMMMSDLGFSATPIVRHNLQVSFLEVR
jgi:hypothetical protein